MIREYPSLEEMEPFLENPEVLNYQRCRELFTPPNTSFLPPPKPRNVDKRRLEKLWKKHGVTISSFEKAMKWWESVEIVVDSGVVMD
jgi:hypothetical protein